MARKQGQIITRGERLWLLRVYLGRDNATRQRRYHNRTIAGPLRAAQRYLNTRLEGRAEGRELACAGITLDQFLDRWLALVARPKLRVESYRDYATLLNRYVRPALGEQMLSGLTPLDLQVAFNDLHERSLSLPTLPSSTPRAVPPQGAP